MDLCVVCHKREGLPYTFYYGKKVSEKEVPAQFDVLNNRMGNRKLLTQYKVFGSKSEIICETCIKSEKAILIFREIFIALLVIAAFIGGFFLVRRIIIHGGWFVGLLIIVFAVAALVGVVVFIKAMGRFFNVVTTRSWQYGEVMALNMHWKSLSKKYKEFWTETRYDELRREMKFLG